MARKHVLWDSSVLRDCHQKEVICRALLAVLSSPPPPLPSLLSFLMPSLPVSGVILNFINGTARVLKGSSVTIDALSLG